MNNIYIKLGRIAYWLSWPVLYVYLRRGSRTRVLILAEGKLLVVQSWLDGGRWGLPGGGLHRNELPAEGAVREVAEETSLKLDSKMLRSLGSEWRTTNGLKFFCHYYAVELNKIQEVTKQPGEIVAIEWVPITHFADLHQKSEIARALELYSQ